MGLSAAGFQAKACFPNPNQVLFGPEHSKSINMLFSGMVAIPFGTSLYKSTTVNNFKCIVRVTFFFSRI